MVRDDNDQNTVDNTEVTGDVDCHQNFQLLIVEHVLFDVVKRLVVDGEWRLHCQRH